MKSPALFASVLVLVSLSLSAAPCFKAGDRVAFLGDSVTAYGSDKPSGHVNIFLRKLDAAGCPVEAIKVGVPGDNSRAMLARLDPRVLSKKPKWMVFSCGVNDAGDPKSNRSVPLEEFKRNVTKILDKAAASNVTVIVMTASLIEARGQSMEASQKLDHNVRLADYNAWLRAEAKRRGLRLADVNAKLWEAMRAGHGYLTCDGIHMADSGFRILARELLATVGLPQPEFTLAPIFRDHMVLQRDAVVPVWGTGPLGNCRISCRVGGTVTWSYANKDVPADEDAGALEFYLPPMKAGGPYEMVVSNEVSGATLVVKDVYVGEVWLAGGQSNMAFQMREAKPGWDGSSIERLRVYRGGRWEVATPETVKHHTAVGLFYGRALEKSLGCPVGILDVNCGGTYAENWMSRGALMRCPTTRKMLRDYELGQSLPVTWEKDTSWSEPDVLDAGPAPETKDWAKPGFDTKGWVEADEPTDFENSFGFFFNGAAWFRREVEIPAAWAGKDLVLALPAMDKHDIAWYDGVEVGRMGKAFETDAWDKLRSYTVPGRLVKAGRATIAVRIWSYKYCAGFMTGIDHFSIGPKGAKDAIPLEGIWRAKIERNLGNLGYDRNVKHRMSPDVPARERPHSYFDSALKPVIPYAMRGVIWYQGESNALTIPMAKDYRTTLAAMIRDWRDQWGLGDLPFGVVQIASHHPKRRFVRTSSWTELRDAQLAVAREVPNVGIVNAIDLGEEMNVHALNKLGVAERLCRWALADVYGRKDLVATAPRLKSGTVEAGGRVRLAFTEAKGGLAISGPVECCYLRGKDADWRAAEVAVDGETLVVSAPGVAEPLEVRYAWADFPAGATIKSKATNLPLFPFRWVK